MAADIDHRALLCAALRHYLEYFFHPRNIVLTDDDWASWLAHCQRDYSDPEDTRSDLDHWLQTFAVFTDKRRIDGDALWAHPGLLRYRDEFAVKAYGHARARLVDYPRAARLLLAAALTVGLIRAAA